MSDKYEFWKKKAEKHDLYHDPTTAIRWRKDFSCKICQPYIVTNKRFIRFWKLYKKLIPEVEEYTGKTEEIFTELLECIEEKQSKERDNKIKGKIGKLLGYMRYNAKLGKTESEIREELITIIAQCWHMTLSSGLKYDYRSYDQMTEGHFVICHMETSHVI